MSRLSSLALSVAITVSAGGLTAVGSSPAAGENWPGVSAYAAGDYHTALKEWEPLAEQGDAAAQTYLGRMYSEGQGVPQNYSEALRLYRTAADQGLALAQLRLGVMYMEGRGVPQDYNEAMRWYRGAAIQGNIRAQFHLGAMHILASQDYVSAHMWFNIASVNGDRDPLFDSELVRTMRDDAARLMTSADIAEAQDRAGVCMASDYQDCD